MVQKRNKTQKKGGAGSNEEKEKPNETFNMQSVMNAIDGTIVEMLENDEKLEKKLAKTIVKLNIINKQIRKSRGNSVTPKREPTRKSTRKSVISKREQKEADAKQKEADATQLLTHRRNQNEKFKNIVQKKGIVKSRISEAARVKPQSKIEIYDLAAALPN